MEDSEIAATWKDLSSRPFIVDAHLKKGNDDTTYSLTTTWKQTNLTSSKVANFSRQHYLIENEVISTGSIEIDRQWCVYNKTGNKRIIIRLEKNSTNEKQYIEIWSDRSLLDSIDVSNLQKHGAICDNDGVFGSVQWSDDETTILYVAESKDNKSKSYFDTSENDAAKKVGDSINDSKFAERGDKYLYKESWGEQMTNKYRTVSCILNLKTLKLNVLDSFFFSAGQSLFCDDDKSIVCVGYEDVPFRLGRIYCTNRESAIYHIDPITSDYAIISSVEKAIRSPSFNHDKSVLIWLQNDTFGPHQQCCRLNIVSSATVQCNWKNKLVTNCIDIVKRSKDISRFPGIYAQNLNLRCWSKDNITIIVETAWYSCMTLISINTKTGKVHRLTPEKFTAHSFKLLDVFEDKIIAARSTPTQPPCLVMATLKISNETLDWENIETPYEYEGVKWSVSSIKNPDLADPFEYILVEPDQSSSSIPLAVWIHGGPHSVTPTQYIPYILGIAKAGFAVLAVNYRGSTGFGQVQLQSLCGKIGYQDIVDVHSCVEKVLTSGNYDKGKVVCIGGSHGGFISAHLIGQYPDFYKAACLRNPVIDLCSLFGTSDIPDWAIAESGMDYDYAMTLNGDDYKKLHKLSPMRYASQIKSPVLLMLGRDDARVPIQQGLMLRKVMISKDLECRTLMYDNNCHALSKVEAEADCYVNIVKFILKHVKPSEK